MHFVYDYNMDCEQMSKLVERFDGASERDQRKIERKINALQKKYHERLGDIAYYVQSIIDITDAMMIAMCVPNIIVLYILAPEIKRDLKEYFETHNFSFAKKLVKF